MPKKVLYVFSLLLCHACLFGQNKSLQVSRTEDKITVDGKMEEESWLNANIATNFLELNPTEGNKPVYKTDVKVLYDDNNIYILGYCYDPHPDSIMTQLGERDDRLNADHFTVSFDTYNKKIDAFTFKVSASGVQSDSRISDESFNAVWESAVEIVDDGWIAEIRIPYYSIRFPKGDKQLWKINFLREIRRIRTEVQWSLVPKEVETEINYWGDLVGLNDIKDPARISLSPYVSSFAEFENDESSYGFGAGADLKVGLNESYTLDMTLLPDFSQVRSDNIVKNLGAFEVVFEEQRPFFQEGVDLFNLGNLFYSRRIGGVPEGYSDAFSEVDSNEVIENPNTARLINVTKVSGRDKNGLGIGIMNAITAPASAIIENTETGEKRELQTNPLVNYNIVAIDQNLRNNSSIYFINLNTSRDGDFIDANVSSLGLNLINKKSKYAVNGDVKISQRDSNLSAHIFSEDPGDGVSYTLGFGKIKGNFKFDLQSVNKSLNYNPNDLGVNFATNIREHSLELQYNMYNPFWILNGNYNTLTYTIQQDYTTGEVLKNSYSGRLAFILPSFNAFFVNMSSQIGDGIDLFESRVSGQKFIVPEFYFNGIGVSTDYSKKIALDAEVGYGQGYFTDYVVNNYFEVGIEPILQLSDKLSLRPSSVYSIFLNGAGYAGTFNGTPKYGVRDVRTLTNILQGKYLFKNNLALTLRMRHYWSYGLYDYYGDLDEEGYIIPDPNFTENADFNFNAFNTDLIFTWQFAPGSFMNIVYKNNLQRDEQVIRTSYFNNLNTVFEQGQRNTLTFKLVYFFDVVSSYKRLAKG
ncbi:carbohydrate binding family 9 domain-containing protein [Salibacteraceae bacterium]|nr:carbohydrate binding family 9 domain-containing protein [Salibacteraceae bacterium]